MTILILLMFSVIATKEVEALQNQVFLLMHFLTKDEKMIDRFLLNSYFFLIIYTFCLLLCLYFFFYFVYMFIS
jgi:hypothetical protein